MAAKVARWKTGPVEPALEEAARWASEVVPLAVGDRARRLADEHEARLVDQARADGIGVRQVLSRDARAARQHLLCKGGEGGRLTLLRRPTYAQLSCRGESLRPIESTESSAWLGL